MGQRDAYRNRQRIVLIDDGDDSHIEQLGKSVLSIDVLCSLKLKLDISGAAVAVSEFSHPQCHSWLRGSALQEVEDVRINRPTGS